MRCKRIAAWFVLVVAAVSLIAGLVLGRGPVSRTPSPGPDLAEGYSTAPAGEATDPSAPPDQAPAPVATASTRPTETDAASQQLVSDLGDQSVPLGARRKAAFKLARVGSPAAMEALKAALTNGPPYLQAGIAEALGECPHPEAKSLLLELANGQDEIVARGAIRGLAVLGDRQAAEVLDQLLFDAAKPESIRTEAALALGNIAQPAALTSLERGLSEIHNEAILGSVIEGLGNRPFSETEGLFRSYLQSPSVPAEKKAAALEALGRAEGEVALLLLQYLRDSDANIRAASAWGLTSADPSPQAFPQLLDCLQRETDVKVRMRLYQALGNQEASDFSAAIELAKREPPGATRIAGLSFWAAACRNGGGPEVRAAFDTQAVPELESTALNGAAMDTRLAAVMALSRAGSPPAITSLQKISQASGDKTVAGAAAAAVLRTSKTSLR